MAEIALQLFGMFCHLGGQYIAPFIAPLASLILPPNLICGWAILLLCFFTPIMTANGGVNALSSSDGKTRNGGRAFGFAFLFYYICMALFTLCVYTVACKVQSNPSIQAAAMAAL